jgi:hypothetical protein
LSSYSFILNITSISKLEKLSEGLLCRTPENVPRPFSSYIFLFSLFFPENTDEKQKELLICLVTDIDLG